jgi:hypothetical protein
VYGVRFKQWENSYVDGKPRLRTRTQLYNWNPADAEKRAEDFKSQYQDVELIHEDSGVLETSKIYPVDQYISARLSGNDGFDVKVDNCPIHGEQVHIILYNQGGYDDTSICSNCVFDIDMYLMHGRKA